MGRLFLYCREMRQSTENSRVDEEGKKGEEEKLV